jgi:hypothetical protein
MSGLCNDTVDGPAALHPPTPTPRKIPGTHFKKSNDIGIQTWVLPACSIVPKLTMLPRAHQIILEFSWRPKEYQESVSMTLEYKAAVF